jgi:DNA invertase Pin-like site-specific DNA recombinase
MKAAVAYFRTSSASNVGDDKDSQKRQRGAVEGFAKRNGFKITKEFYDAAVSGADPITERPGFVEMLRYIRGNGARVILVENAGRFARDLAVQITGHELLKAEGFELIPVDAPDYFIHETPTAVMVRNILGAVSQFQKDELVAKLKSGRDRKRKEDGKCEGRKGLKETDPMMVKEARRLRRKNPKSGKVRSFRTIAAELADLGFTRKAMDKNKKWIDTREPYSAMTIKRVTT